MYTAVPPPTTTKSNSEFVSSFGFEKIETACAGRVKIAAIYAANNFQAISQG